MIDVHAHYLPPRYREALLAAGIEHPDGMPAIPSWSLDGALATMDALDLVADPARVLYGSDWPFTPEPAVAGLRRALDDGRVAALTANALALFPRFA